MTAMTEQFTQNNLLEQSAAIAPAVFDLADSLGYALRMGAFDDDPDAKAQAEALFADANGFYSELLDELLSA
jgi:hypothetical protein